MLERAPGVHLGTMCRDLISFHCHQLAFEIMASESQDSNARLTRMEEMMARMVREIENLRNQQPPPVQNTPPNARLAEVVIDEGRVRNFQKMKPPTFEGGLNVPQAEEWLTEMEKVFRVTQCTEVEKTTLATYNLKGEAQRWWNLMVTTEPGMTWGRFKDIFKKKYIPKAIRDSKATEFQNLKQRGSMTVTGYDEQFTSLANYAEHLIPNEDSKARRFEDGLLPDYRKHIKPLNFETYPEVLNCALMLEGEDNNAKKYEESKKRWRSNKGAGEGSSSKKPYTEPSHKGRNNNKGGNNQNNNRDNNQGNNHQNNQVPTCDTCGKAHRGICWRTTNGCFGCGEMGHIKRDCPKMRSGANVVPLGNRGQGAGTERRHGKAFALVPRDPHNTEEVVAGKTLICSMPAFVLIDSGSTHSFISTQFSSKLAKAPEPLGFELLVSQPMSRVSVLSSISQMQRNVVSKEKE
ncbi:hypothetical protein RHSIM_Rhsim11G0010200 [Rhododendron simsii]|uniref:CCHC-type domain-containing protein n=1 Tax=Rhododendron simsii TaxID=118357 RepID=A0A834G605_RHOSS|nr:hypothetical protein RHSIM_Rhsim11G0010200 [Rhododendron simsii]